MLTITTGDDWIGVILCLPSGVSYRHQSGGYACKHPMAEGVFAPIPHGAGVSVSAWAGDLSDVFTGDRWGGWCSDRIDTETADVVDRLLGELGGCRRLDVNRERLHQSMEAWVHLSVGPCRSTVEGKRCDDCTFAGDPLEAILIWPNSD